MTPESELSLQAHNARTHAAPNPPAGQIDIPVASYIIPDENERRMIRLEAKVDAIGSQLNWVVQTVTQFVEGIKSSPLSGMLAKRMGQ